MPILKQKEKKPEFYSLNRILKHKCHYYVIFGQRSNGKTFAVLKYALEQYLKHGKKLAILRRWKEDFKQLRGQQYFENLEKDHFQVNHILKMTHGNYDSVVFYRYRWYLARTDESGKQVRANDYFAYAFSITEMEHDKGAGFPDVGIILFDEFITRGAYAVNEFLYFQNCISTIIRLRDGIPIFMLANSVNKFCPYFAEMGLKHAKYMKPGDLDIYTYGDNNELKVAVEHTETVNKDAKSNVYFAFDKSNPHLQMITGGEWEIGVYPHCPYSFTQYDIKFIYFIEFDNSILQCEIVVKDGQTFTFIHRKTTPLKNREKDIILSPKFSSNPRHVRNIAKTNIKQFQRIFWYFQNDKVFYDTNESGEIVRNYLQFCGYGIKSTSSIYA